jgi:N-acetylmuramoyl-L-alanine amidase
MNSILERLPDQNIMALTIDLEAANQGLDGMAAVGSVILNRVHKPGWWGRRINEVCLANKQFSCYNEGSKSLIKAILIAKNFEEHRKKDPALSAAWFIAWGLIQGYLASNVGAATHYHTKNVDPPWDDKMKLIATIGDHIFYAKD